MGIYSSFGESATNISADLFDIDPNSDSVQESEFGISISDAYELMAECDHNYNAMMKAIGIHELSSIETYGEVLYEAVDIRGFVDRMKQFFKTLLQKIASVVKRFFAMVDGLTKNDAAFLKKYESVLNKVDSDKIKDKQVKVFKFTHLDWTPDAMKGMAHSKIDKSMDPAGIVATLGNPEDIHAKAKALGELDSEDEYDKIRGATLGTSTISSSDFSEEITKYFRNGETSRDTVNLTTAMVHDSVVTIRNTKDAKNKAKKTFDAFKKYVDDVTKSLDAAASKIDNAKVPDDVTTNGPIYGDAVAILNKYSMYNKYIINASQTVFNGQMSALKDNNRQARMICTTAMAANGHVSMKKEGFEHFDESTGSFFDNVVMK